jgi:hypothetical protein
MMFKGVRPRPEMSGTEQATIGLLGCMKLVVASMGTSSFDLESRMTSTPIDLSSDQSSANVDHYLGAGPWEFAPNQER